MNVHAKFSSPPEANEPPSNDFYQQLGITPEELQTLLRFQADREKRSSWLVFLVGVLLTPISLIGALAGFVRGYNRILSPQQTLPWFYPMRPIIRVAMVIGAVIAWLLVLLALFLIVKAAGGRNVTAPLIAAYLIGNTVISWVAFTIFRQWQYGVIKAMQDERKFGSARFASDQELTRFRTPKGLYIGSGHYFADKGHLCTTSGTRGGKGTNIIIPNLLGAGEYHGSWVVIDPKGENAAITARYQAQAGRKVVILNPWGLFEERLGKGQRYNPLDILNIQSVHLVDDVQMIAEMIIPVEQDAKNRYFSDNARTIVTAIIMHMVVNMDKENRHLGMLYKLVRYSGDDWLGLLADMRMTENPMHRELLDSMAQELLMLQQSGENSFGSIIATVLQGTDFLKSPALQAALQSGYNPYDLANGNSTVYVIIPADKLQSHGRWLRLVVTSTMRAVIRQPGRQVTFLLDEFAALGYLPEIETALSTYAGYNVTVWPILQSLIQLKNNYGNNWESFIANTAVKHYFNVNDNFSAEYVSKALGETTNMVTTGTWITGKKNELNRRALATPDEVRRHSQHNIFAFIGDAPPTIFNKQPYYTIPELIERADNNPYIN